MLYVYLTILRQGPAKIDIISDKFDDLINKG